MRVTLAYPYDGNQADETIEIDDAEGRRLVRDGRARPAAATGVDVLNPTVGDVRSYAADHGITVTEAKKQLRDQRDPTRVNPSETPDTGDEHEEADRGR
jgi:hypothetical protein